MKHIFRNISLALLAALALGVTACTDEYEYTPASANAGGNAFIATEGSTSLSYLPTDEQVFSFTVNRVDSTQAGSVALTSTNAKFSVPTVSFAAGERSKTVTVSFDIATGTTETTTIAVDPEDAYLYGATELTYTITRFFQYDAVFVSAFFEEQWDTPVYQVGDGTYMIPDCYDNGYDLVFTIAADNTVTFADQPAWYSSNYGDIYVRTYPSYGACSYDPEEGIVSACLFHHLPNSNSGWTPEVEHIVFTGTAKP